MLCIPSVNRYWIPWTLLGCKLILLSKREMVFACIRFTV